MEWPGKDKGAWGRAMVKGRGGEWDGDREIREDREGGRESLHLHLHHY